MVNKIALLGEKCKDRSRFRIQWQYSGDPGWILSGNRDHFFLSGWCFSGFGRHRTFLKLKR